MSKFPIFKSLEELYSYLKATPVFYIPQAYSPTFGLLENILQAIDLNEGYQYLPRIWSGMIDPSPPSLPRPLVGRG